jgi:hypothetical protein
LENSHLDSALLRGHLHVPAEQSAGGGKETIFHGINIQTIDRSNHQYD